MYLRFLYFIAHLLFTYLTYITYYILYLHQKQIYTVSDAIFTNFLLTYQRLFYIMLFCQKKGFSMNNFNLPNIDMPRFHVGLRTIKTIVVVFLSLCLAYVRQGLANPLYIAIAAILCIQPTMSSSRKAGTDRLIATVIGGFWGIIVFVSNNYFTIIFIA